MQILSHRGWWATPGEKNSSVAFLRSFAAGYGTETDLRDALGRLVISHDPPAGDALGADAFFELYKAAGPDLPLALNVKSDGLQSLLRAALEKYAVTNYFLFDMSLPDALVSIRHGLAVFTRQSEWEPAPLFYKEAAGVWLDCFHGDWMTTDTIARHLDAGKRVCLVSPELHRRDPRAFWETLAHADIRKSSDLLLCTDRPDDAKAVLHD
jgi:glycerophosphoryl diester phosphodiesterase